MPAIFSYRAHVCLPYFQNSNIHFLSNTFTSGQISLTKMMRNKKANFDGFTVEILNTFLGDKSENESKAAFFKYFYFENKQIKHQ